MGDPLSKHGPEYGGGGGGPGWNLSATHWSAFAGRRLGLAVFCTGDAEAAGPMTRALADTALAVPA